jgi:uroporphyrinogen-III decarboxylase
VARRDDGKRREAIGLDWTSDPRERARIAAGRLALQGNLDPVALFAAGEGARPRDACSTRSDPRPATSSIWARHPAATPIDSVAALVDEVRAYSRSRGHRSRLRLTYAHFFSAAGIFPAAWFQTLCAHLRY